MRCLTQSLPHPRVFNMNESSSNSYCLPSHCHPLAFFHFFSNGLIIHSILTPSQRTLCAQVIKERGLRVVDEALVHVKSEEAEASIEADLKAIRELIQRFQGGFTALNNAVKVRLRSWFKDIAGVVCYVVFKSCSFVCSYSHIPIIYPATQTDIRVTHVCTHTQTHIRNAHRRIHVDVTNPLNVYMCNQSVV
jgi:hypothetical protein